MKLRAICLVATVLSGIFGNTTMASAADIRVLSANSMKEAYQEFAPVFEKTSGHKLSTTWEPTVNILKRLRAGEQFDVVVLPTPLLNEMIKEGRIAADSGVVIARSGIGAAVPLGAPKPDISSGEAVKKALLAAKGIGYSSGSSGVYLEGLFARWGIADAIKAKLKRTAPGVPVGSLVAGNQVDIGFQQISEIMLYPGIQYVGPVPKDMQHVTAYSAGIQAGAKQPDAARALVQFILSPAALPFLKHSGLEQGGS